METVITAVGDDHVGLADPLIHHVTGLGANIAEIQMYDHDDVALFAMLMRIELPRKHWSGLTRDLTEIGRMKGLTVRVWTPDIEDRPARLAICTTYRSEPARALLEAVADGLMEAEAAVMIGNRNTCRELASEFGVAWQGVGDAQGCADFEHFVRCLDQYEIDYVVLARFMRVLPPEVCWQFAGGRIINLHHGLLPSYPGMRPYHDAYSDRMLTFGATCHFIVPDLDAGNQIICQRAFSVLPGTPLPDVVRRGQEENEPACLVEGMRRVIERRVRLHFHHVIGARPSPRPAP